MEEKDFIKKISQLFNKSDVSIKEYKLQVYEKEKKFDNKVILDKFHENFEIFNKELYPEKEEHYKIVLEYNRCVFNRSVSSINSINYQSVIFNNCVFNGSINLEDIEVNSKFRFRECIINEINLRNTKFNELADFWRCTFKKPVIFYKTDFNATTVFSASTFFENALFTYSLIKSNLIFRGTKFCKGLDLSIAINEGNISVFDISISDYEVSDFEKYLKKSLETNGLNTFRETYETCYEKAVSELCYIPIKNKRETFGILKSTLEARSNLYESLLFKKIEKDILRIELKNNYSRISITHPDYQGWKKFIHKLENRLDRFNLWLNKKSNYHGSSYGQALLFILITSTPFFIFSIAFTSQYQFTIVPNEWTVISGVADYVKFLNPAHGLEYLGESVRYGSVFYILDFIGRIVVGYGIYQFVQAFRKFR